MLYLNYEDALSLQDEREPLASLVAVRLSAEMISDEHRNLSWMRPQWPFDMRYFYGSVCRLLARHFGRTLKTPLPAAPPLTLAAIPDLSAAPWPRYDLVKLGLATRYLADVDEESVAGGPPYDATFALHVAGRALNREFIAALPSQIEFLEKHPQTGTFDEWLTGFNAPDAG